MLFPASRYGTGLVTWKTNPDWIVQFNLRWDPA